MKRLWLPNPGYATTLRRPPVDRHEFADDVVGAYDDLGRLSRVGRILGRPADGDVRDQLVAAADGDLAVKNAVRPYDAIVPHGDIRTDVSKGADFNTVVQPGGGIDDGGSCILFIDHL